jgi:hypothetical protein
MTYSVTWCLVGDDERCLDTDVFPETFSSHEEAVAFVLSRIDKSPSFGYDRSRRFWWLRGAGLSNVETRFCIMADPIAGMQSLIACAAL